MSSEKRIKELEEKLAFYEGSPAAEFYTALVEGIKGLTTHIKNKSLDFDDSYQKSLFALAKDSDKIMIAMSKGMAVILPEITKEDKRLSKSQSKAI